MPRINDTNIIFFHGFGSSNQTNKFQAISHPLKQCVSVDYASGDIDAIWDLYQDMILESMRVYKKTILVGHSFGAYFANRFAVKYCLPVLLIAPCMRPNVYLKDRLPEIQNSNYYWEKNYSAKAIYMIENDDECFNVDLDINLIKDVHVVYAKYMTVHRFNGGHHRICREDVINQELDELIKSPLVFKG